MNAIHFAIKQEKLNFLSYLFEGDFHACEKDSTTDIDQEEILHIKQ